MGPPWLRRMIPDAKTWHRLEIGAGPFDRAICGQRPWWHKCDGWWKVTGNPRICSRCERLGRRGKHNQVEKLPPPPSHPRV